MKKTKQWTATKITDRRYLTSIPASVLAKCATVDRRADHATGYQRACDEKRVVAMRTKLDAGEDIPGSIILSAREDADFKYLTGSKAVVFNDDAGVLFILDGQHRFFAYTTSSKALRVPCEIFAGLSHKEEVTMFLSVNEEQVGISKGFRLEIANQAGVETKREAQSRALFDALAEAPPLKGFLDPIGARGKMGRAQFNGAMAPLWKGTVSARIKGDAERRHTVAQHYLQSWARVLKDDAGLLGRQATLGAAMDVVDLVFQAAEDEKRNVSLPRLVGAIEPLGVEVPREAFKTLSRRDLSTRFREILEAHSTATMELGE